MARVWLTSTCKPCALRVFDDVAFTLQVLIGLFEAGTFPGTVPWGTPDPLKKKIFCTLCALCW